VLRAVPGEVLELTFSPTWDDEVRDEPGFRIVWQDLGRDRLPDGRLTRPAEWTRAPRDMTTTARSAGQTSHVTPPEPRAARWAR
jgi:hypothetical protein